MAFPPGLIIATPSCQPRITFLRGNLMGSPRWTELSKTVLQNQSVKKSGRDEQSSYPSESVPW